MLDTSKLIISNNPNIQNLINTVDSIAKLGLFFKIGKTGNVHQRHDQYFKDHKSGTMTLVLKSTDANLIEQTEALLTSMYINEDECKNKVEGSPGVMDETPPYFVYVVQSINEEIFN